MEEIAEVARSQRKAIRSDLVVLLAHLLEWQHRSQGRSTGCAGSIVEHRRRIRDEIEDSPSLPHFPGKSSSDAILPPASRRRPRPACPRPVSRRPVPTR
jgi:hypothetical protein